MPLPAGTRYRVKTYPSGEKVRLAFRGKRRVIEAKNIRTGAKHTPAEFARDRARRARRRRHNPGRRHTGRY